MTEDIETSTTQAPANSSAGADGAALPARAAALADERPEAAVGVAFAGGLLVAIILKRLAR